MGFLTKRATFLRLKVNGPAPGLFGDEHLDRLREFEAGRQRIAWADTLGRMQRWLQREDRRATA